MVKSTCMFKMEWLQCLNQWVDCFALFASILHENESWCNLALVVKSSYYNLGNLFMFFSCRCMCTIRISR